MTKKIIVFYLAAMMFVIGIAPRVEASFAPSQALSTSPIDREADLDRIQTVLEAKLVTQRLADLGFTPQEIKERLSAMNDQEVHRVAQNLDELKVGKDGLGVVIAVLVIIVLVLVIINLTTGKKVVLTK